MSDRLREIESRIAYECNVLYKLVPLRDVLRLARRHIAQQRQNNQREMSSNEAERKEKKIVRAVYKMLRRLINKTKLYTVLMNGRKWMERAVTKADRRLEKRGGRVERNRRQQNTAVVMQSGLSESSNQLKVIDEKVEGMNKEAIFTEAKIQELMTKMDEADEKEKKEWRLEFDLNSLIIRSRRRRERKILETLLERQELAYKQALEESEAAKEAYYDYICR